MTFQQYVNSMEHLIGAFRVGALSEKELLDAIIETDLQCEEIGAKRLEIAFNKALSSSRGLDEKMA